MAACFPVSLQEKYRQRGEMDSYAATSDVMVNADDRGDGYYDGQVR